MNVLAHDCDPTLPDQGYSWSFGSTGSAGTVTANSANNVVFTPASGYSGTVTFAYCWTLTTGNEIDPTDGSVIPIRGGITEYYNGGGCPSLTVDVSTVVPVGTQLLYDLYGGGSPDESCQCGTAPATDSKADPVNTATGDYYESRTDLTLPGAGPPLEFTRTYDAQAAQAELAAGSAAPPLGYGWTDNFAMNLAYNSTTQTATVTDENGAQVQFSAYVSGTSPGWCTGSTNFCAGSPRISSTLNQNGDGTWTLQRATEGQSPMTFTFNSSGVLTKIADETGDTIMSSSYSPGSGQTACPSGQTCQAWTSSASGRELVLATNSSNQLTSVFDANSSLASTFAYSGTGCSTWASGEPADLCSVVDPGSLTESFTYDSANTNLNLQYDMLTDTPPTTSGDTVNVYNSTGQVTQQTDPAGGVTTFDYSGSNDTTLGGSTTITNYPLGTGTSEPQNVTVDTYSNDVLTSTTTGYGTSDAKTTVIQRDPVSLQPLASQDGNMDVTSSTLQTYGGSGGTEISSANVLTSTDAEGNTTQYAYNAQNQEWCAVDAADTANGVSCPSTPPSGPPSPGSSDPDLGASINFFNSSGQLTASTDALGNTTTYSYTSGVSGIPNGLMYCSVDPVEYQKSVSCPAYGASHVTGTTTHTFDGAGDNLTTTDADGNTTTYVYGVSGHPGLVSSTTDPDGTVTSYTYNGAGEVLTKVASFNGFSATTAYAYDSEGRQYCEDDPNAYASGTRCPSSPPSSASPPSGVTSTFYDADGRVIQTTNALGGTSTTAYDQAGNAFCTVAPVEYAAGVRCPSSEPSSPPTVGSDSYLGATITTYDATGQVVQVTNPLGGITLKSYDSAGNLLSTTTESNNATSAPNVVMSYTYDLDNRLASTTVGAGTAQAQTTSQFYDPNGNAYCSVSANANASGSWTYQCPSWNNAWITRPPNPSSLYSSTPTKSQANNVTTTFYDANGNQLQTTNPDVQTSISAFDGDGRTYCTSDPTNVGAWLSAHSGGTYPYLCPSSPPSTAPAQGSNPGYTTTIFDAAGRTLSSTDQVGDTTSYAYAPGGQTLTKTDPRGKVSTDCYYYENGSGQCATGAPAGGGTADNLYYSNTQGTAANVWGDLNTFTYDPGGQTATTTNMAGTATDSVDANGDTTGVTYSNTASGYSTPANVSYTFNVDGTRHTMTDATGTTTYSYDANGDVTSQALVASSGNGLSNATTSYGYYTTGVQASVTYPSYSGHASPQVTYTYDVTGAMASETDWLGNEVAFSHDSDGNTTAQDNDVSGTNPSGTSSTAFSYDPADQNTGASSTINQTCGGSENLTQSFAGTGGSRNPDGQLTQYETAYSATCSGQTLSETNYSYDPAGRVTYQGSTAQGSAANKFAYDPSGDPTTISSQATSGGSLDTYTQSFDNTGEVTGQSPNSGSGGSASTYGYDTIGDQEQSATGPATTNYGYNQADQMTSASTPTGSAGYLYTGDGLEAASTSSPASTVWSSPSDVDSTRAIDAETCTSSSFCVAVDTSGYATVYNGSSWSAPTGIDFGSSNAVSCTSSSFCVAVGANGIASIYTGSWSAGVVDSGHTLDAVTCTSSTFCVAVDASGYSTIYNGSTWSTPSDIDSSRNIDALSCSSSSFCVAVDASGYATVYNGSSWSTPSDIDSARSLDTVTCTTSSFCVAADGSGYTTIYNGSSWSTASDIDSTRTINHVACPSSSECLAIDTSGYSTTYNGSTWSTPSDIDGSNALEALSCSSASACDATDNAGNVLTYNGSSWSSATNVGASRSLNAISCPSSTFCSTVGASGYATTYAPSSQSWGTPSDVNSTRAIDATTCVSSTFCVAVGASGYATIYNGSTWSTPSDVDSTRTLDAVSCTSASFCVAVDSGGYATIYNGSSWSTPTAIDFGSNAVSCSSSTFCVAAGNYGLAAIYNGTSWSNSQPDSTRTINAVTCTSSSFCVAVDASGYAVKYTGSWASPIDIDSTRSLSTVSCVSSFLCVAGGASGYVTTYSAFGGSWSTPSDVDSSRTIKALVCTTFSQCLAVDTSGYATTFNGSGWTSPSDIDGSNTLEALTCANASVCTASDNDGNVLTYSGTSWSDPVNIDSTRSLTAIACPTTTFCATTDASGYAVTYAPLSASTSQLTWDTNGSLPLVFSDSTNDYVYGPAGTPVEQVSLASSAPTYLTYTASDDTWLSTNETGDETGFWGYDAFGNQEFGSPTSPFGYSGQYTDATTSQVNDRARWYEPETGGFTARDPDFSTTDTAYTYAGDNPVNENDPSGEFGIATGGYVTIEGILANPVYWLTDLNPPGLEYALGGIPQGWAVTPGIGNDIPGWVLRQYRSSGTPMGNLIRWNFTASSDHPRTFYWNVRNGSQQWNWIPAGNWPGGPPQYVGPYGGYPPPCYELASSNQGQAGCGGGSANGGGITFTSTPPTGSSGTCDSTEPSLPTELV
jgi:RHS repeat-associated protein